MNQTVKVEPVVTAWCMIGPPLRTRRNRPVFTFWNVTMGPPASWTHRWLAKPLPLFPGCVNVTSPPPLLVLLVRASPRFSRTNELSELLNAHSVHEVVLF